MGECYLTRREKREVTEQLGIYKIGADARPSGVVVIPNKVTTLATRVFQNDGNVTNITLPPYLQEIQARAFENCALLETIVFPQSIQTIHEYAFNGCEKIQAINVPDNIPLLKPYAFGGKNIKQLTLNSTFSPKLWDYAYADNHSIESVTIDCYSVSNGAFEGSDLKIVTITDNVRILRDKAFKDCKSLTTFNMGEEQLEDNVFQVNLLEIGDHCFRNSGIQTIAIPKSIKRIGEYCFAQDEDSGVHGLRTVILEEGLTSIGVRAFSKSALEDITIPQSMESIKQYAFDGCTALSTITFEDGLKSIGTVDGYCFSNCGVLSLNFPSSIERISKYAFSNCNKLTDVTFNNDISKDALGKGIFKGCTSLYQVNLAANTKSLGEAMFKECSALKTIELPKGFQYLGERCFEDSGLEVLTIPETISFIGSYCFNNCQLSKISLPKTLQTIEPYTFAGCNNLGEIVFDYVEETIETGDGVHVIKDYAFANSIITTLSIPYTIQEIGPRALSGSKITTLKIDKIKNSIPGAPWGASSAKVIWRESTLTFSSNVPFFELWISQNDEKEKQKVNTVDNSKYVFEPLDNGITLNCVAYAPNKPPVVKQLKYTRLQREVEENFNFSELNSPYKIIFTFTDAETGKTVEDVQLEAETIFEDFKYTYRDYEFYLNEGTIFSYNITRPGYSGQSISTMVINDDTIPPDEDGNRIKKFDIRLSKNGYIYYEIKPPYKEFPQFTKHLIDGENYEICDITNTMITNYLACTNTPLSNRGEWKRYNAYIKFRTPDDVTSRNTISVTFNPSYIASSSYAPSFWIGIGEKLYYQPNDHSDRNPPDVRSYMGSGYISLAPSTDSQQSYPPEANYPYYYIASSANGGYISFNTTWWNTIPDITITKTLTNLLPNREYYLMFSTRTFWRPTSDNLIINRLALKKISFSSCPIDDGAAELLPGVITGEKECLFDGMGKQEPYVNPSYFDSISDLIFDKVFDFAKQGVNFMSNVSNCCGNFIYKSYAIDNVNGGKTDAAIAKLQKPIQVDNCTKLKITCINYHNYTGGNMDIASYCRLCDEDDIQPLVSETSYYWGDAEKPWREMFSGLMPGMSYYISTTTIDLTEMTGEKTLYVGVHHGATPTDYTAYCGIVELELQ